MKKTIIVGVTSSIAAFKSAQLVSDLIKKGYDVEVIMSKNACEFITPLTFSSLTKHKTYVDTFDRQVDYQVEHISLAKKCDAFIIAPATANVIAKIAHGLCDDMLTTTFLACDCPKLIAPAMNSAMLYNTITQDNLKKCKSYGMQIIESDFGLLACGDEGKGKLANIDTMIDALETALESDKSLLGKKICINAGPTREAIDPVRYITNHSSGKMGYALAKVARNMGAEVTLISGPVNLKKVNGIDFISVNSTQEMFEAMKDCFKEQDYIIAAAAPSDFKMKKLETHKIKKSDTLTIDLEKNIDILKYIGDHKTTQKICGFAAETDHVLEYAKNKLINKNCDMLVVNDVTKKGAGFNCDTNIVSILTRQDLKEYEIMSKEKLAKVILKTLANL